MNSNTLTQLFNLGRVIDKDSTFTYIHLAYKYNLDNYRLITSGELIVRGKDLDIPNYIIQFVIDNNEVIMIANKINDIVISITFRSIKGDKQFIKLGSLKNSFYGLSDLDSNFKYGDPIVLVEGQLDRDAFSKYLYRNTLGIMTSHLSLSQVQILKHLTNKIILCLDNDEAGKDGTERAKKQLKGTNIKVINHESLKDIGDLVNLDINNRYKFEEELEQYKIKLEMALL